MAHRQEKQLQRIWNEVTADNPSKSSEWHVTVTLDIYNTSYPNDPADREDLMEALERGNG